MPLLAATIHPAQGARLSPAVTEALVYFRSPTMAEGLSYALFTDLRPTTKPLGYASLEALARRILRDRKGEVLQLSTELVKFRDHPRPVTRILAELPTSGRTRLIGFAWHAGRPREALEQALEKLEPSASYDRAVA